MLSIDEGYYFFSFFFCKFFSELFAVSLVKSRRPWGEVGECPPSEYSEEFGEEFTKEKRKKIIPFIY
jgi:hypothetical protein